MKTTPSESDAPQSSSGQFDTVSKQIVRANPDECLQFYLGTPDVQTIRVLETEQPIVKWYRADSFIHANVHGEEVVVHLEFQTQDSRRIPMPYRMTGYVGLGIRTFEMPIYSHVLYLHPNAGLNDPGEYVQRMPGYEIIIKYKVIRLCELDGQVVLDAKVKGIIPFAPLMKPPQDMNSEEWLQQCIEVAEAIPMDAADKPDYLASMVILCDVIFDFQDIRKIIPEEILMESSVIQHFTQQGERKNALESLLDVLDVRFQSSDVETLKPTLESIEEIQHLRKLLREAVQVPNLDEFRRILASNGS